MAATGTTVVQPAFHLQSLDEHAKDRSLFFLHAFPSLADETKPPDVVAYGGGTLHLYDNPHKYPGKVCSAKAVQWSSRPIGSLVQPTGMTHADVTGNGHNDIIIADLLGTSLNAINEEGGRISWFENPGNNKTPGKWVQREIGRNSGTFCVQAGHFTNPFKLQVVSFPVASRNTKVNPRLSVVPVRVVVYTCPDDPKSAKAWPSIVANNDAFHCVKDVKVLRSQTYGGLDKLLVGSKEGINLMWFDGTKWMVERVAGLLHLENESMEGILALDYGKAGADRVAYIVAGECPAFGLTVHVKNPQTPIDNIISRGLWTKHVLDDFHSLECGRQVGSFHDIICGDFDGDGVDEFVVNIVPECSHHDHGVGGLWYYKPVDLKNGKFAKWRVGGPQSGHGHMTVGNFTSNSTLDIVNMSASEHTHEPVIELHANSKKHIMHSVSATRVHDEVVLRVPERGKMTAFEEVPLLSVGNTKVTLLILPPGHTCHLPHGIPIGVKVLDGSVSWNEGGKRVVRQCVVDPKTQASGLVKASDCVLKADQEDGALFMMFMPDGADPAGPYTDMSQVTALNILPSYLPDDVRASEFPFIRVDRLDWGKDDPRFKNAEFYNCSGIYIRRDNNADDLIVHMQMWTAGVDVNCGFHNHSDKSFCEVHYCFFNGTGNAGMWWTDHATDPPVDPIDRSKASRVMLPSHSEHGPLWDINEDGSPTHLSDGKVSYPWHAWLAGEAKDLKQNFPGLKQSYDLWMAFEFPSVSIRKMAQKQASQKN